MISLSIALARLSHRPDANSKLAAAVMNRNWMDRSATCGGGDGCYYCETSGLWHSVWGLQQPQNCSQVSLLLLDAIKLSKWRIIWSVCIFFFLADFTMLQQEHKIFRKQFSRFVSANYCFLCFAKCGKKYEEPLNNLLAWIVLKIKQEVRHSILDHLFDCLPKSEYQLACKMICLSICIAQQFWKTVRKLQFGVRCIQFVWDMWLS